MKSTTIGDDARKKAVPKLPWHKVLVALLLLDLAYVINAMDRQVFPILIPAIRGELNFNPGEIGLQATIFTLGMGLAAIPAGYVADKIGRKNMILMGLIIFSAATALQGIALGFWDMAAYRVIAGAGEGIQNAALYAAVGTYFFRNRAMAIGTLNAAYGIGAFGGPLLGNLMMEQTDSWRTPLFVFALFGVFVLIAVLAGVPKQVSEHGLNKIQQVSSDQSGTRLFNRNVICCTIVAVVGGFAIYGWLGLYPTFLRDARDFSSGDATLAASMFGIGALFSIPIGAIADRWDQRRLNMIGIGGLMLAGGMMFTAPLGLGVHMLLAIVMGVCFTGILYTNTNSLMQRSVPEHRVGTVVGVFVAALYIPASVAGYFFATMANLFSWEVAGLIQMVLIPALGLVAMVLVRKPTPARVEHSDLPVSQDA